MWIGERQVYSGSLFGQSSVQLINDHCVWIGESQVYN